MESAAATLCDLCHHQPPSLYCSSDSAFLCSDCDSQVHAANFLVARHIRFTLCTLCKSFTSSSNLLCRSCSTAQDDALSSSSLSSSSSSSSSACVASTRRSTNSNTTPKTTSANRVMSDWKTRDVLVNWCTKVGVTIGGSSVIEVARYAFEVWCLDCWVLPYRVGLAASLWFSLLRLTKNDERKRRCTLLKRLEEISGVPAKSIVVAESKVARMLKTMKRRRVETVEESSDEC